MEIQVGLNNISLDEDPHSLSGGYKRRLALAIQLVRKILIADALLNIITDGGKIMVPFLVQF